jgi:secreted trypsin-like serine protease
MDIKYILKIFIISILILSLIILLKYIGFVIVNKEEPPKELIGVVTIEGMNNIPFSVSKAFCDTHSGFDLEKSCNNLTKYNCNLTSCCVYTSKNKCQAGNSSGPIFNTDTNGKTKKNDYYIFQNKYYSQ